jgi:hypothetical protein
MRRVISLNIADPLLDLVGCFAEVTRPILSCL